MRKSGKINIKNTAFHIVSIFLFILNLFRDKYIFLFLFLNLKYYHFKKYIITYIIKNIIHIIKNNLILLKKFNIMLKNYY